MRRITGNWNILDVQNGNVPMRQLEIEGWQGLKLKVHRSIVRDKTEPSLHNSSFMTADYLQVIYDSGIV
jgi:hypothetical protein